ncbi:hypothetical protein Aca07nite_52050 [Actinoplanes capillaceus]|uniref:DUF6895 domain-containing protein n=1 Tax=Actinoplanes campanulatus TaxID=113559 RepID=A0ABQ3WNT4_9ACTN|nr:hypothetical protein [Actinoplanes capillaceus]GID47930.1 hypothetical protein Aca07nite_52050 [Actinoplanes capillaceus]
MTATVAAHRLAESATGWLNGGIHHLRLDPDDDETYKSLGETALAAGIILREGVAGAGQQRAAHDLLEHAWRELGRGDVLYARQVENPAFVDPLEIYAHFARAGLRHPALEELLRHLGRTRPGHTRELLPNRRLAVANAARITGLEPPADMTALAARTWLGAASVPWLLDRPTAYCMTHTVFHLTDWGADPGGLTPEMAGYLELWLPVWLDVWTEIAEWDLVGELLIVDACLPAPVCPPEAWTELAEVQRPDGRLPRDAVPGPDEPGEAFRHDHHPTVVAAIAGTLGLSRRLHAPVAVA